MNNEIPKYIKFIEYYKSKGFNVKLHRAKTTVSKYIFLTKNNKTIKVRFSNHKPSYFKEINCDCDFYVGANHTGVWKTAKQIALEINKMFNIKKLLDN